MSQKTGALQALTRQNFDKKVIGDGDIRAAVLFYTDWCRSCGDALALHERLAPEYTNIRFFIVNMDENRNLAHRYNVRGVPTLLLFNCGDHAQPLMGLVNENEFRNTLAALYPVTETATA